MTEPTPLFGRLPEQVSLDAQITELKRERAVRVSVYSRWIENGWLKPSQALRQQAALDAAIATLEGLKRGGQ